MGGGGGEGCYLSDGRVGRTRSDEGDSGGGGIVGHHRLLDLLLHVGNVPEAPHSADTLEERPAGDEPGVAVVDHQGFVHVVGQFLLHRGRTVRQDRTERGVGVGSGHRTDLKTRN